MRRWLRGLCTLLIGLVAATVAVVATVLAWPGAARSDGPPTLPSDIASNAPVDTLMSTVQSHPAGRAIALVAIGKPDETAFPSSLFAETGSHTLVVGADRESYRMVGTSAGLVSSRVLLSPDGRQVLWALPDNEFALLDLGTGAVAVRHGVDGSGGNLPLAWSPDGRYVAYASGAGYRSGPYLQTGRLGLINVLTDAATWVPVGSVAAAEFAPDSQHLAVITADQRGATMSLDGALLSTWDIPGGTARMPNPDRPTPPSLAWSPDGGTIAVQTRVRCADNGTRTEFVDAGSGALRAPVDSGPCLMQALGWQSPTSFVGLAPRDALLQTALVLASPGGNGTTVMSQLPPGEVIYAMELARGLLGDMRVRPAAGLADFGPWEGLLIVSPPVLLVTFVAVLVARSMRRRRLQPLTRVEAGTLAAIG